MVELKHSAKEDMDADPSGGLLRQRVRSYVNEVLRPVEEKHSRYEDLPQGLWKELQEEGKNRGLWRYEIPEEFGGQGVGLLGSCIIAEEVNSTRVTPFRHNDIFGSRVGPILYSLVPDMRDEYLYPVIRGEKRTCFAQTEPDAGSDPTRMTTTATLDGDEYVINGMKKYIGAADVADFAQVMCRTATREHGRAVISCLLVDMDTPGVRLVGQIDTMMGDRPWIIEFDNVRVPSENLVGTEGAGFALSQQWLTRNRVTNHGARSVGIAQRALDMAIERSQGRETFGKVLAERQAVQFMIADSAIDVQTARLLVLDAARRFDDGESIRDASYMVKVYCTEAATKVVDRSMQIHGGMGLTLELPLEHWFKQLRSVQITEGVTEVLRWRLGRNLTRDSRPSSNGA